MIYSTNYLIYTIFKENTWFWADFFTSNYTLNKFCL